MLKIASVSAKSLTDLAEEHYQGLNQKVRSGVRRGQWKQNSLVYKLRKAIVDHINEEQTFFEYLLDEPGHVRLKNIITGSPTLLKDIIDDIGQQFPAIVFREKDGDKWVFNKLGHSVHDIFNYVNYRKSESCTNYLQALGLKTRMPCPYCNHDEMALVKIRPTMTKPEHLRALLDLDHFFPKSKYPFLAISIFNLVPSCTPCNSRFKGDKEFSLATHIHPYITSFEDVFLFELEKPYLPGQTSAELVIKYKNKIPYPENSINDLYLLERYNTSKDSILEMLMQLYKRPLTNLAQIADLLPMTPERITLLRYGGIPTIIQEISKYPLGKLKRDICLDMNIYH